MALHMLQQAWLSWHDYAVRQADTRALIQPLLDKRARAALAAGFCGFCLQVSQHACTPDQCWQLSVSQRSCMHLYGSSLVWRLAAAIPWAPVLDGICMLYSMSCFHVD